MSRAVRSKAYAAALTLRSTKSPVHRNHGWGWTPWTTCWATNWAYCVGTARANESSVNCFVSHGQLARRSTRMADFCAYGLYPYAPHAVND